MNERKFAYIGRITNISPIKKADFIVSAEVDCGIGGKWMGTVKKGAFKIGDLAEVYLQDALLPKIDEFDFMEQYKYRISMKRFKGVPSECLIMPMTLNMTKYGMVGTSIDEVKGVTKYEKPLSPSLGGIAEGSFPVHLIPKTDELNFQTVGRMIKALRGKKYYSTIKADGSSGTIYKDHGHFGCCTRNLEIKKSTQPIIWKLAEKYKLEKYLPEWAGIQFEMLGPGINGNRLGLKEFDMRVFNVYSIMKREYLDAEDMFNFCKEYGLPTVEIIDWDKTFDFETSEQLRKYAERKYENKQIEGVVFRPMKEMKVNFMRLSFKVLNLKYKE